MMVHVRISEKVNAIPALEAIRAIPSEFQQPRNATDGATSTDRKSKSLHVSAYTLRPCVRRRYRPLPGVPIRR